MKRIAPKDIAPEMVNLSGQSQAAISKKMGKSINFVGGIVRAKTIPRLDTVTAIADACEFDVVVRQRTTGNEIIVDPE